jgi:hypothetical protein
LAPARLEGSFLGVAAFVPLTTAFLARDLTAGFLATAAFAGSSFLSLNSNAGLGTLLSCGLMREISAAGFTPAAAAALAALALRAACFGLPSMSGLTITWLS